MRFSKMPALVVVADLPTDQTTPFLLVPGNQMRAQLATDAAVLAVRKLRLSGTFQPLPGGDWQIRAQFGATITQECVLTLENLKTRIDVPVQRTFVASKVRYNPLPDMRIPDDENLDLLSAEFDLYGIALETIMLEKPLYPQVAGARLDASRADPGDQSPEDALSRESPLANLSELYRQSRR